MADSGESTEGLAFIRGMFRAGFVKDDTCNYKSTEHRTARDRAERAPLNRKLVGIFG